MRKILTGFAIIASLILATAAAAQGTGSSVGQGSMSSSTLQGNGATGATSGAAPIGHRQPRATDLPEEKNDGTAADPRDAALERALRSICRGC